MPRNVEIKAELKNFDETLAFVKDICNSNGELLNQEDIFFRVPHGRLKLRNYQAGRTSELISYSRADCEGPKVSSYSICKIQDGGDLLKVLTSSLGVVGVVKKERHLFLHHQTRIHLDRVEGLGNFLELEVVLNEDQSVEEGGDIARELISRLNIDEKDLIKGAYIDLI